MRRGIILVLLMAVAACDSTESDSSLAVYEVRVADQEAFRMAVATDEQIDAAEQHMSEGRVGVIHGTLKRGDGGFNDPFSWHMAPESVSFPDFAVEVCDGRPESDVEADLEYWIDNLGYYCPWGARIVRRVE